MLRNEIVRNIVAVWEPLFFVVNAIPGHDGDEMRLCVLVLRVPFISG